MLKVLQITDMHIMPAAKDTLLGINTENYFRMVIKHAHQHHGSFDLLLLTGDIAQTPVATTYKKIVEIVSSYPTPCICLPGNHDDPQVMAEILNTPQISCAPSFETDSWSLIFLNSQKPGSAGGHLADPQLTYLNQQLNLKTDTNIAIFMHHHVIPSGSVWMDTMQVENHQQFFSLINPHQQVKTVICGHIHQDLEKIVDKRLFLGTPSSCFQFKPQQIDFEVDSKPPGYRVVEFLDNGAINSQVIWLPVTLDELDLSSQGY